MQKFIFLGWVLMVLVTNHAKADDSVTNKANDPLTPQDAVQFQNYYEPTLFHVDNDANSFLLRYVKHISAGSLISVPQIVRFDLPINTVPKFPADGHITGLDNLEVFDLFVLKQKPVEIGVGPILSLPTASKHIDLAKWQGGLVGIVTYHRPKYMLIALAQWQQSFERQSGHPLLNGGTFQPIAFYNLPHGFYLRSSGIWTFNFMNGNYFIPLGYGAGRVWKNSSGAIFNVFLEPQSTVSHKGNGLPQFQLFAGLNILLPD